MCLYLYACLITLVTVSLGCFHDDVRAEPGSWLVVGTVIPVFDGKKAMQTVCTNSWKHITSIVLWNGWSWCPTCLPLFKYSWRSTSVTRIGLAPNAFTQRHLVGEISHGVFQFLYALVCICLYLVCIQYVSCSTCINMHVCDYAYSLLSQDYVFFIPPPPHFPRTRSAFSPSLDECCYGRVAQIFKMQIRTDAGDVMECQCHSSVLSLKHFRITVLRTVSNGGPALLRSEPSCSICHLQNLLCILFPFHTSSGSCPWSLRGIMSPFPEAWTVTRTRVFLGVSAIITLQGQKASCFTSTHGPWFGPQTMRLTNEKWNKNYFSMLMFAV